MKVQPCNMKDDTVLSFMALIQITSGQMTLEHLVYISDVESVHLLIEKHFLDRLMHFLCFQTEDVSTGT